MNKKKREKNRIILNTNKRAIYKDILKDCTEVARKTMIKIPEGSVLCTIEKNHTFKYLLKASLDIWNSHKRLIIFVPKSKPITGKIIGVSLGKKEKFIIAKVLKQTEKDKFRKEEKVTYAIEIGSQRYSRRQWKEVENATLDGNFYMYNFVKSNHTEAILLSQNKLEDGEYNLSGLTIPINDYKKIGESFSGIIATVKEIIIPHSLEPFLKGFSKNQFYNFIKKHDYNILCRYIFNVFRHPPMFEELVLAFLFSGKYGGIPLHFYWIAKGSSGKTKMSKRLNEVMYEDRKITSGEESTFKHIIPSFAFQQCKAGAFIESKRIFCLDEFHRIITRNTMMSDKDSTTSKLGSMNSLLDHELTSIGSAFGSFEAKARAKVFVTTNAIFYKLEEDGIEKLIDKISDLAFLSRWLIFFQPKKHKNFIFENKVMQENKTYKNLIRKYDFLNFYDFMQTEINYPKDLEGKIKERFKTFKVKNSHLTTDLLKTRFDHHIICLIDGACKLRMIKHPNQFKKTGAFFPNNEDIDKGFELFNLMLSTWNVQYEKDMEYNTLFKKKEEKIKGKESW